MSEITWTRQGKKAGPANVLNGRYLVEGYKGYWKIWDRKEHLFLHGHYFTMSEARRAVEADVREGVLP